MCCAASSEAKRLLSVDEDRVYLTGDSMGGWGTWNVATRHPDLFAAIAPVFGGVDYHSELTEEQLAALDPVERFWQDKRSSWSMADSLINMPVYVHHGDADAAVNVEWSRYGVRMLQRWGYDLRYQEYPGKVHEALGSRRQCRAEHSLVPGTPARSESAQGAHPLRRVAQRHRVLGQRAPGRESAGVHGGGRGSGGSQRDPARHAAMCWTSCCHRKAGLVDTTKPVKVIWNGVPREFAASQAELRLTDSAYKPAKLHKTAALPGGGRDFYATPFAVVIGTTAKDPEMKALIRQAGAVLHRQLDRLAEVFAAGVHRHRDDRGRHRAVFAAAVRRPGGERGDREARRQTTRTPGPGRHSHRRPGNTR